MQFSLNKRKRERLKIEKPLATPRWKSAVCWLYSSLIIDISANSIAHFSDRLRILRTTEARSTSNVRKHPASLKNVKPLRETTFHKISHSAMLNQSTIKTIFESLPLDMWIEILSLLDIQDASSLAKADPRTFGAFIEYQQVVRFNNAIKSSPSPLFHRVLSGTDVKYSSFRSWLKRHLLKTCIVPPRNLFPQLSLIIALKDSDFVASSSILSDWSVSLKGICSVSWDLVYRTSLFGFSADAFHHACGGTGKCVVVVKAENGRIASAYNEDGFSIFSGPSPNRNGFIMSIKEDGSYGARFDRTALAEGVLGYPNYGPDFFDDLALSSNCQDNECSYSILGQAYRRVDGAYESALFGQEFFRVLDYEVFKIVIE